MHKLHTIVILLLLLWPEPRLQAQSAPLDSLRARISREKNDSVKATLLNDLAWDLKFRNLKESEKYCLEAIDLCTRIGQLKSRSSAYNTLGLVKSESNDFEKGKYYLNLSLQDKEVVGDRKGSATVKNNIGICYKNMGDIETARRYYDEAMLIHTELGNARGQADVYSNLGILCRESGQFERSDEYFLKALELRQKLNDKNGIAVAYNNLSANSSDQADFKKSLEYLYQAARLFEEIPNKAALVTVYGNIAKINKDLFNTKTAIGYCKKALALGAEIGAYQNMMSAYASLGDIYFEQKQYAKAFKTYSQGLALVKEPGGGVYEGHFHLGRGVCRLADKQVEEALKEINMAIRIARERRQDKALARALQTLARLYNETDQHALVRKPLDEAIRIAKANSYGDLLMLCYRTYSNYHQAADKPALSEDYSRKANTLRDTLFRADVARAFAEMQTRYETGKKEAEIRILKQQEQIAHLEIEAQGHAIRKQRYLLGGLGALILLLLLAGYFYFSNQRLKALLRQEALVRETEEQERTRIAKDIHDELGSGLSKISFLSELILRSNVKGQEMTEQASSISETARKLVVNMKDLIWALDTQQITLAGLLARIREYASDYLDDVALELELTFSDPVPDLLISRESHRQVLMIVKESLSNIVRHAQASLVEMEVHVAEEELLILVSDNGSGLPAAGKKGNGILNMKARAESLGGRFGIESGAGIGTKLEVVIPLRQMRRS